MEEEEWRGGFGEWAGRLSVGFVLLALLGGWGCFGEMLGDTTGYFWCTQFSPLVDISPY